LKNNWLKALPPDTGLLVTNRMFHVLFSAGTAEDWPAGEESLSESEVQTLKKAMLQRPYFDAALKIEYVPLPEEDALAFWFSDWREVQNAQWMLRCYETILDNINEGVIATDRDSNIIIYNRQLAEFEDLDKNEIMGKRLMDVYEWSMESSEHMQVLKTGIPIDESNYIVITHLGKQNQLVATTLPIFEDGEVAAAFSISRNVTKIREIYNRTIELQPRAINNNLPQSNGTRFTFEDLIFKSKKMAALLNESQKAALSPSPVLIYGETGTGKEIIAQSIHNAGKNATQPFIGINCAAIPESLLESLIFGTVKGAFTGAESSAGFFEQAQEGTIYLDEINSMPLNLQAKLLRALQEKRFRRIGGTTEIPLRCKVISSTNKDPLECVLNGQLRQDLYFRLSVMTLFTPPLRERPEDVEPLAEYFVQKYEEIYSSTDIRFDENMMDTLKSYNWPGNVRELEHVIERAISLMDDGELLTPYRLPPYLRKKINQKFFEEPHAENDTPARLHEALQSVEKRVIMDAYSKSGQNMTKAAEILGIKRQNLQYRMRKLGISPTSKTE